MMLKLLRKNTLFLILALAVFALCAGSAQAQAVKRMDYQGTGNWDAVANWHIYDYNPDPLIYIGPAGHIPIVPDAAVDDARIFIGGHANMTTPIAGDVTVNIDLGATEVGEEIRVGIDSKLTIPVGRTVTTTDDVNAQNPGAQIDIAGTLTSGRNLAVVGAATDSVINISGTVTTARDFNITGPGSVVNVSGSVTATRDINMNSASELTLTGTLNATRRTRPNNNNSGTLTVKPGGSIVGADWRIQGTNIFDNSTGLTGPLTCTDTFIDDGSTFIIQFIAGPAGVEPIRVATNLNFDNNTNANGNILVVNVLNYSGTSLLLFTYGGTLTGTFTDVTVVGGSATVDYSGGEIKLIDIVPDTTPPQIADAGPNINSTVIGEITHVSVTFTEPMTPPAAGDLLVNGQAATVVTDLGGVVFLFSGFPVITDLGTVPVVLDTTKVKDLSGNAITTGTWEVTVAATPDLLFYDGFDYTAGELLESQPNWFNNGVNPTGVHLDILSDSSLTFAGLPASKGGRLRMSPDSAGPNTTVGHDFSYPLVGDGRSIYTSFLYKPVTGLHADTYWAFIQAGGVMDRDNVQRGRFAGELDLVAAAPAHSLHLRFRSVTGAVVADPIAIDTTVLLVGKLTIVPGADNDVFEVWVDPDPTAAEPATADYTATGVSGEDIDPSKGFVGFRMRARSDAGDFEYDEMRIATNWETVMGKLPATISSEQDPVILPDAVAGLNDTPSKTFNINNLGSEDLMITSATVSGLGFSLIAPVAGDFTITVPGGLSSVFEVGFDRALLTNGSSAGIFKGELSIISNDLKSTTTLVGLEVEVRLGADPAAIKPETWMLYED